MAREIILRGNRETEAVKAVEPQVVRARADLAVVEPARTRRTVIIQDGQFVGAAAKKRAVKKP